MSPWLGYSLVRLGIFGAVFTLLFLVGIEWWVSALFATAISFTVGYIFFASTRQKLAEQVKARAEAKKHSADPDALAEDH